MDPTRPAPSPQPLLVFHTCETCRVFKTQSLPLMKKHLRIHETSQATCATELAPYRCHCGFESDLLVSLRGHSEQPHRLLYCRNCTSSFHSRLVFLRHKRSCAKQKIAEFWFECDHCRYRTGVKQTLERHVVARHTPARRIPWLECGLCDYRAKRKDHLRTHFRCMHPQDGDKWLQCAQCPYRTTQKDRIQKHVLCRHSSDYGFHCDQCEYRTKLKYHLRTHVANQHPPPGAVQWFQCAHCPFKTKLKHGLRKHIVLKHMKPKRWFECEECSFRTKQKHILKSHVISRHECEERIRWFECAKCGYRAKRKGHLVRHMGVHRVEKK